MRYDIVIIGTGPAGMSAAINAKIRNKTFLLIGEKDFSEKVGLAPKVDNYLGLPGATGPELGGAFAAHLVEMGITITEGRVKQVLPMGTYFSLDLGGVAPGEVESVAETAGGVLVEATALVLATGIVTKKGVPGEEDYLGNGVGYCATCDGPLYRGKTVALVGEFAEVEEDVTYMAELAEKVYYTPLYEGAKDAAGLAAGASREGAEERIEVVKGRPVRVLGTERDAFSRRANALTIRQEDDTERTLDVDGIFFLKKTVPVGSLVPGLAMDEDDAAAIKVARDMSTSVPGLFACGDCTGRPYQYMKAAGEGLVAGQSAAAYVTALAQKKADKQ